MPRSASSGECALPRACRDPEPFGDVRRRDDRLLGEEVDHPPGRGVLAHAVEPGTPVRHQIF